MDDHAPGFWEARHDSFVSRVYGLVPPDMAAVLAAELEFLKSIIPHGEVLEIGCGNGRLMHELLAQTERMVGVDINEQALREAEDLLAGRSHYALLLADATRLPFPSGTFDCTFIAQSTFGLLGVVKGKVLAEMARVTKVGGLVVVTGYAPAARPARVAWYEAVHQAGLMGPIDWDFTTRDVIVTGDGFVSEQFTQERFAAVFENVGLEVEIQLIRDLMYAGLVRVTPQMRARTQADIQLTHIQRIELPAHDIDRANQFYGECLGLKPASALGPSHGWLLGQSRLVLRQLVGEAPPAESAMRLVIGAPDPRRTEAELRARGVVIEQAVAESEGRLEGAFRDSEGNVIWFGV